MIALEEVEWPWPSFLKFVAVHPIWGLIPFDPSSVQKLQRRQFEMCLIQGCENQGSLWLKEKQRRRKHEVILLSWDDWPHEALEDSECLCLSGCFSCSLRDRSFRCLDESQEKEERGQNISVGVLDMSGGGPTSGWCPMENIVEGKKRSGLVFFPDEKSVEENVSMGEVQSSRMYESTTPLPATCTLEGTWSSERSVHSILPSSVTSTSRRLVSSGAYIPDPILRQTILYLRQVFPGKPNSFSGLVWQSLREGTNTIGSFSKSRGRISMSFRLHSNHIDNCFNLSVVTILRFISTYTILSFWFLNPLSSWIQLFGIIRIHIFDEGVFGQSGK